MNLAVYDISGKQVGSYEIDPAELAPSVNKQLLHDAVVMYQANQRQGTFRTKNRGEVAGSTKKLYKQKGTGSARHGSARVNLFRGGGRSFGPTPRSHAHDLPKKVRALGLRHALSAKAKDGGIIVVDTVSAKEPKTQALRDRFEKLGLDNVLIIGGAEIENNFRLAARGIPNVDVLPIQGINVYDILRRHKLVLSKDAIDALEARFK